MHFGYISLILLAVLVFVGLMLFMNSLRLAERMKRDAAEDSIRNFVLVTMNAGLKRIKPIANEAGMFFTTIPGDPWDGEYFTAIEKIQVRNEETQVIIDFTVSWTHLPNEPFIKVLRGYPKAFPKEARENKFPLSQIEEALDLATEHIIYLRKDAFAPQHV